MNKASSTPNLCWVRPIATVGAQPELASSNSVRVAVGSPARKAKVTMHGFYGAGGEHTYVVPYKAAGDHPAVLCGADAAPTPVEWVLHALATCLIGGIGNISAARGVKARQSRRSPSRAISICAAFSVCRTTSATASTASRSRLPSTAMHRPRSFEQIADAGESTLRGLRRADQRRAGDGRRQDAGHELMTLN